MITQQKARSVSTNASESAEFTIKANGKAFKILIDGLYADKIQSITREIWSNALDSHVYSGCRTRPFDITMPTSFNPTFRVRDYGTGLSHDNVMHLYTTVFESTKEASNDVVGKLGLGSKSPFSYTDTFSVTSWFGGEKRFYAAMIGETGVPTINFLGREPSDEENGLEVSFPVGRHDVQKFNEAAQRVSHGFDVKPVVTNKSEFSGWPEHPYRIGGKGWCILDKPLMNKNTSWARMGCVLYPLDMAKLDEFASQYSEFFSNNLIIDFPVGDLEVTASREDLSYGRNDPTTKSIIARLKSISFEMGTAAIKEITEAESYWEACRRYNSQWSSLYKFPSVLRVLENMRWKGRVIHRSFDVNTGEHAGRISLNILRKPYGRPITQFRFSSIPGSENVSGTGSVHILYEDRTVPHKQRTQRVGPKLYHAYTDIKSKASLAKETAEIFWVRYEGKPGQAHDLLDLLAVFDNAVLTDVASLPEPTNQVLAPRKKVAPIRSPRTKYFDETAELTSDEMAQGGLFITTKGSTVEHFTRRVDATTYLKIMNKAKIVPDEMRVIVVPSSRLDEFSGKQWTTLHSYCQHAFDSILENNEKKIKRASYLMAVRSSNFIAGIAKTYYEDSSRLPNKELREIVRDFIRSKNKKSSTEVDGFARNMANAAHELRRTADYEKISKDSHNNAKAVILSLVEKYPMANLLFQETYGRASKPKIMSNYVTMCDILYKESHKR